MKAAAQDDMETDQDSKSLAKEYEMKPALTKKHLKARLSWSKSYELWDADAWNKIISIDETKRELHSNK